MTTDRDRTLPYWLPIFVFGVFTTLEGYVSAEIYPWMYVAKMAGVVALFVALPQAAQLVRPSSGGMVPAVVVGLAIFAAWLAIEQWVPYPHLGSRVGFDPFAALPSATGVWLFIAVRLFGLVVVVPIVEELFWRGFALRFLTNSDFESVPMGTFSTTALVGATAGFAVTHPEWIAATIAALAFTWLLRTTRSLFAVIVAHAVANLALGVYILTTHDWRFW